MRMIFRSHGHKIEHRMDGIYVEPRNGLHEDFAWLQALLRGGDGRAFAGKALKPVVGDTKSRYGWQNVYRQKYPELGTRWMANCDIPDLDLLPAHYGIKNIRFSAGMENTFLHLGIWCMSWLVRLGLPLQLEKHAAFLLRVSHWFDHFGTADGGMHVNISGIGKNGHPHKRTWFIVARDGDGPQIPCVPAIILARKLATDQSLASGAKPCVGMVTLAEYLEELKPFNIRTYDFVG